MIKYILSALYGWGVRLRHFLYDRGWLRVTRVPAVVVSVGNIVCGGSGKTPLVQLLCRHLKDRKVAILTRGYRSKAERRPGGIRIVGAALPDVSECGDEPFLLAQSLQNVPVYVGADRIRSALRAVQEGAEVLVLDDGMQHRRLGRDIECVVLDGKDLFAGGHLLPKGRLRDQVERLREADVLFVNHIQTQKEYEEVKKQLRVYSTAPVIGMGYRALRNRTGKVAVFCGLGTPERFVETVERMGFTVVATHFGLDHRPFNLRQLHRFAAQARQSGACLLVCSEKDSVKIPPHGTFALPIEVITGEPEIRFGEAHLQELLQKVQKL